MPESTSIEAIRQRVADFVDSFLKRIGDCPIPCAPPEMAIGSSDKAGWSNWKPLASPVTLQDVEEIENDIDVRFPPAFVAYLTYRCVLQNDTGIVRLPKISTENPLNRFLDLLGEYEEDGYYKDEKLLPFGYFSDDSGVACFDLSRQGEDGECPVILVDFDYKGKPGYRGEERWPSFLKMLDFIQSRIESYDEIP